jgi:prevent-host-death family protein
MKAVNIAELKNRLSFYLNEVKAGREVLVKDRNNPIARIVPIQGSGGHDELRALAAQGKIRLGEGEIDASFWDLPGPRVAAGALRRALKQERDEV